MSASAVPPAGAQSCWVIGGTGGLGAGVCRALASGGLQVHLTYRTSRSAAEAVVEELPPVSAGVHSIHVIDLADLAALSTAIGELPAAEHMVFAAGELEDGSALKLEAGAYQRLLDVSITACAQVIRGWVQQVIPRPGSAVVITSLAAKRGIIGQPNYCAAKAGAEGMIRSIATEVARLGIRLNAVAPGYIQTRMATDYDDSTLKKWRRQVPMRRFGTSLEIGQTVRFLLSEEAGYITGATLPVDGGLSSA